MNHGTPTDDKVVITGGSGFLGQNLAVHLGERGRSVVIISRQEPSRKGPWTWSPWDGRRLGEWAKHLEGARAVVNLAGRSVDCIKTPDHCDQILRSRVESTRVLGQALQNAAQPPPVWVQMSTAHNYGDPGEDAVCEEDSAFGYGLAPQVGQAWEQAMHDSVPDGVRTVIARTSFVLGRSGGALGKLARLARWGLGGRVGSGRQGISWLHEADMNQFFVQAIEDERMNGAYLVTAPKPVSHREFMAKLRRVVHQPVGLPAASWMVRIAAPLFLRTDPELVLYGRYCVSRRLPEAGFEFQFPELSSALQDLLSR